MTETAYPKPGETEATPAVAPPEALERVRVAANDVSEAVDAAQAVLERAQPAVGEASTDPAERARREALAGGKVRPAERAASRRRRELEGDALPIARATAEKWAATTATLFTALGFAAIWQGRKQVQALASSYSDWAAGAFLGAFALALLAIVAAAWAAQGASPIRALKLPDAKVLQYETSQSQIVGRWMTASRAFSTLAIVGVLVGLGLLLYAPSVGSARGPQVLVVTKSGQLVCGSLIGQFNTGEVTVTPTGQRSPVTLDARHALTVTAVPSCPSAR
jgi:hypothetical protein